MEQLFLTLATEIPEVSALESDAWYLRWGVLLGMAALVCLVCFKNPKRSHDN